MTRHGLPIVAIDGPAASGKSSTAKAVAERLGLVHVDSGALYRTATWLAVREELRDAPAILAVLERSGITLRRRETTLEVLAGGMPVEPAIRADAVTRRVSEVAAMPAIRAWVDRRLREAILETGGGVMDGRDIGTVVFPDATLKVFLTASPAARAGRRLRQAARGADAVALAAEAAQLAERDRLDAGRAVAPLRQAPDAKVLDTTGLGFEEQVDRIVAWAEAAGLSAV
jgi:cytidylate kinase